VDNHPVNDAIRATIPLGRTVTTAEVARTVRFLLSPDAAGITGRSLRVDGGLGRSL
jgi:NAD(P)-dependent dehydrogenase (short-subunit alcohol dehydrogenase family)